MSKFVKNLRIIPIFLLAYVEICTSLENDPNRHIRELDPTGKYRLEWLVDTEGHRIFFNVTVQTLGFVGFGISKRANDGLVDLIVGGVDSSGRPYFSDRNVRQNQFPNIDRKQDWILHLARESATHTFLSFSRSFDTCDPEDVPFDDDTVTIEWLYGESDNILDYFRAVRGTTFVYIRDPDLIPRSLTGIRGEHPKEINGRKVSIWNVNSTITIPAKRTTYTCDIKKLSIRGKHHILGYNVRINKEGLPYVHHLSVYYCQVPKDLDPAAVYEPFVDHQEECYSRGDPNSQIPSQYCQECKLGFAIGGGPTFLPDHVGLPIGESGQDEYYIMRAHYNNPEERNDIKTEVNIDFYYTSQLRKYDGGILLVGTTFPGSPGVLVPPGENEHRIFGHCSPHCTNKLFPPAGIKMLGGFLHSHYAGRKSRLSHFRNGRELPFVLNDDNYDITFQTHRMKMREAVALPGDQLTMRCSYETRNRQKTTVGGYGSDQEMCVAFLFYYNRLTYPLCYSELISPAYTAKYLAGAANLTWNQSKLEFMATAPRHLANMTVSEISDSPYVNWNREKREQLRLDHFMHPQVEFCPSLKEHTLLSIAEKMGQQLPQPEPQFVAYPQVRVPYIVGRTCPNSPSFLSHGAFNNFPHYDHCSSPIFRGYRNWHFK